jgi:hypothetical protein
MKKRNLYLSLTIMCGLFTVAFTFDSNQTTWLWQGNEPVAIVLAIAAIFSMIQLIRYQKLFNHSKLKQ